nr:probable amino acid permease 7 [Ipomoea trifida]
MHLHEKPSGNEWTALAHIITAVIGAGVLLLPWSIAQLGWIAGPIIILCFASVTLISAFLLCNCHELTDQHGKIAYTHGSYLDAVQSILGNKNAWFCRFFVSINSIKLGILYTITSALSIRSTKWLCIVAAFMSLTYSSIGSGLSLEKVIDNGEIKGGIGGWPSPTAAKKVWPVAQALGNIAFAFPFSIIILEIQDTLKESTEKATMKKASIMAVCISTIFYLCCGGFGYAAFGTETPGNLLAGFGFYEPYWLLDFANACIAVQLCGGYQVFSQSLYAITEKWLLKKLPQNHFFVRDYNLKAFRFSFLRVIFRTTYVAIITGIAILFPYLNQVVGVAGAITFWPIVVYFPVEMYLKQKKIESWTTKKIVLRTQLCDVELSLMAMVRLSFLRVIFRSSYVGVITGIAILVPYFNQVVGVAGAINFWPIVVYFPVEMYLKRKKIG